jgi:hypothetical protein
MIAVTRLRGIGVGVLTNFSSRLILVIEPLDVDNAINLFIGSGGCALDLRRNARPGAPGRG